MLPQKTKRGNSNTAQRQAIMNRLLKILPAIDIYVLTMDREFIGNQWFKWLEKKNIGYIARIKLNTNISDQPVATLAKKVSIKSKASR